MSPLVQSYQQSFNFNQPYGKPIPRPLDAFAAGGFGPFLPVTPMPIDKPREDSGRPSPRRWQYPVGWNLPTGEPGTEGLKLATFATLRSVADMYSVARACVNRRISEIVALEWDIVPTHDAELAMRGDSDTRTDWEKRRKEVREFFQTPDADRAKYPTFASWLSALLEDLFVLDAVAIWLHPPRRPHKGPFHSDLASLDLLDGSTIRPLLDMHGASPRPPNVAYQQYLWGVPRVDLTAIIQGVDIDGVSTADVAEYRADQLAYLRFHPRAWTPYGYSPVEQALLPITVGLARQQFQWDYYQDGSIPGQFIVPGPDVSTPEQIRALQDALNSMAGDIGAKHRIVVLPPGSKADPQKPMPLADQFDEWIVSQVTMTFGLTPLDLGIAPRVRAVQSPAESREMSQTNSQQGQETRITPVTDWLKDVLFDHIVQHIFGQEDMQWSWGLTTSGEDAGEDISRHVTEVQNAIESIDEARVATGRSPWGLPESSVPIIFGGTQGPVLLSSIGQQPALPAAPPEPGKEQDGKEPTPPRIPPRPKAPRQLPPGKDDETTPAHQAARATNGKDKPDATPTPAEQKTVTAELQILDRYLRKGRNLHDFTSDVIPAWVLTKVADTQTGEPDSTTTAQRTEHAAETVAAVAAGVAVWHAIEHRAQALAHIPGQVAHDIAYHARAWRNGDESYPQAVDAAVQTLSDGIRQALTAGAHDAAQPMQLPPSAAAHGGSVDHGWIAQQTDARTQQQRDYITRLYRAVQQSDPDEMHTVARRFDMYGSSLTGAYNAGFGHTVQQAEPSAEIIWRLGETEHCALCLARDGKSFTFDTLPGWPGDGDFGGHLCEGGPNCGCWLEFVRDNRTVDIGLNTQRPDSVAYYAEQDQRIEQARTDARAARQEFLNGIPGDAAARAAGRDTVRQQLAQVANNIIRDTGGYQGVTVEPWDIPAELVASITKAGEDPEEVAYEASLVANVPDGEWDELCKFSWNTALHPRDMWGRFTDAGNHGHSAAEHRGREKELADTLSTLEVEHHPHFAEPKAPEPRPTAMLHPSRLDQLRDRGGVSFAAVMDQARRTRAYSDFQLKEAQDHLRRQQEEMVREESRKVREKMLIGAGAVIAALLMGIFLAPMLAAAPLAVGAVAEKLPEMARLAVEHHRKA